MAVGYNANQNLASFNGQLGSDAAFVRSFYDWLKRKYSLYNGQYNTVAQLTALGVTATGSPSDQAVVQTFTADLNRLIGKFEGATTNNDGEIIINDLALLMGTT